MISLKINNIKDFTAKLLVRDLLDSFFLVNATIQTHSTYQIDGRTNADYYNSDDVYEEFTYWKDLRPICYEMIKGKQLPCFFKLVFKLNKSQEASLLSADSSIQIGDLAGCFLNIKYEQGNLTVTTGTSLKIFTLDKTLEHQFDHFITDFLTQNSVDFSIL